ncbi:MAG: sulfur carrier protein ThiS [Aquificota bacterium]|jgi:sulfur carrier protein|nr:MAG: sulfur carrier protein ThiS [Aquificota bacterium]
MRLVVNGKDTHMPEGISILELLERLEIKVREVGLAVAVNGEIVPKSRYKEYILKDGDSVEIVNIVGGG